MFQSSAFQSSAFQMVNKKKAGRIYKKRRKQSLKKATLVELIEEIQEAPAIDFTETGLTQEEYTTILIALARKRRMRML